MSKQFITEAQRLQQLAGILKEVRNLSQEDVQIEKVNKLVQDAINEFPNKDDRDKLDHAFERTTFPEADIFAIADKLTAGEITKEDVKMIVANVAKKLKLVKEN